MACYQGPPGFGMICPSTGISGVTTPSPSAFLQPVDFNDALQVTQAVLAGNPQALAEQAAYDAAYKSNPPASIPAVISQAGWDPYLSYLASVQNPGGCVENGTGICTSIPNASPYPTPRVPPAYNPGAGIVTASGIAPDGKSPSNTAFQPPAQTPSTQASSSGVQATGVVSPGGTRTLQTTALPKSVVSGPVSSPMSNTALLIGAAVIIAILVLK